MTQSPARGARAAPATKRALVVLSHAMERAFDAVDDAPQATPPLPGSALGSAPGSAPAPMPGLVLGLFQQREFFDIEADRYAALAAAGHTIVVGFAGSLDGLPPGVHGVSFPEHDDRARDWVLVTVRDAYASALVARDAFDLCAGERTLQASRLFDADWTFHRDAALEHARAQLERLVADLPTMVAQDARAHLDASAARPASPAERRLAAAANHLISSLNAGHHRALALRMELESTQTLAERDQLTGLNNRHFLERFLGGADRPAELLTLLVDVDDLKRVNDTHGHAAGDAVLSAVAAGLREHSRPGDVIVRWGGDEFLLLLPGAGRDGSLALAERLAVSVRAVRPSPPWEEIPLSVSIGVSATRRTELPLAQLDAALQLAKAGGKGRAALAADGARQPGVVEARVGDAGFEPATSRV